MKRTNRPVIGLSSYREVAAWGAWRQSADLLPANYANGLRGAGAVPILLPAGSEAAPDDARAVMEAVAGLVLTGGADVDPALYGEQRGETTDRPRTDRDDWEIALVHAAIAAGRPVLAVCRGLQVLNVALGGTLIQHLPDVVGNDAHRGAIGTFERHPVRIAEQTRLADAYGDRADVPTHHHQAVDVLGRGLVATAWAADGTIEAATCPGRAWINGIQWHPEVDGGMRLFQMFVSACDSLVSARPSEAR